MRSWNDRPQSRPRLFKRSTGVGLVGSSSQFADVKNVNARSRSTFRNSINARWLRAFGSDSESGWSTCSLIKIAWRLKKCKRPKSSPLPENQRPLGIQRLGESACGQLTSRTRPLSKTKPLRVGFLQIGTTLSCEAKHRKLSFRLNR